MPKQTTGGGATYTQQSGQRREKAKQGFKANPRVFVYGTLKEGYGNNRLLSHSKFLGAAQSVGNFVLGNVGFPYAFPSDAVPEQYKKLCFPVVGELYEADSVESFLSLDFLEGYPSHYDRRITMFDNDVNAWMYVQPDWYNARYCDACTLENGVWSWP